MRSALLVTTNWTAVALAGACAVALAGCAGGSKDFAEAAGLATTAQEPKPFVQESRVADAQYIPIGRRFGQPTLCKTANSPPPGPTSAKGKTATFTLVQSDGSGPCKPAAQFKTIEAELEAKRISNEAAGAQAQTLGKILPPPAPAAAIPTN